MDYQSQPSQPSLPQEVVLTYCAPKPREVVLTYRAPLDPAIEMAHAQALHRKWRQGKRRRAILTFLACVAVGAIVLVGILFAMKRYRPDMELFPSVQEQTSQTLDVTIPLYDWEATGQRLELADEEEVPLTAQEVYTAVNPAIVTILSDIDVMGVSIGTGVIFSSDGFIVTNYHVVEGAYDCTVVFSNDYSQRAYYIGGDPETDLAVLKMEGYDFPTASFGQSDWVEVGDTVYAIGSPLGMDLRGTFTNGMVSALERDVTIDDKLMEDLIQTNTALNTGNSGGPLINEYGQVVGINTLKMSGDTGASIEGLGFSIPSSTVARVVWDLTQYGEVQPEPTLGITVGVDTVKTESGRKGALIFDVTDGSAADLAGLLPGDILLRVGGERVYNSEDVLRVRREFRVGDTLEVVASRDGEDDTYYLILQ